MNIPATQFTPALALALWERALADEIGIIITIASLDDKRRIEKMLYDARRDAKNPDLEVLILARPGDKPEEFWIIKRATDMSDIR